MCTFCEGGGGITFTGSGLGLPMTNNATDIHHHTPAVSFAEDPPPQKKNKIAKLQYHASLLAGVRMLQRRCRKAITSHLIVLEGSGGVMPRFDVAVVGRDRELAGRDRELAGRDRVDAVHRHDTYTTQP